MPTYTFICDDCKVLREVIMPISHFEDGGKRQECSKCGKLMKQKFHSPTVIYHGSGFHSTDYPRALPTKNVKEVETELEHNYYEQMINSEDYHESKEVTETVRVDQYRDTKTGEKVHIPVDD